MNTIIQKPVGVCLAQAHTSLKTDLVSEMDRAAREKGCGIIAFNSSLDYYWSQKGDHITACIYRLIRFDQLSALVILHDNIYDLHLMNYLITNARQHGLPVFYLGGIREDCISITDDYEIPYKDLVRHVIRDHGVRDMFYIAGLRNEDNSVRRLRYFREVLEEYGIPLPEENVAYGNYLDTMAADIVRNLAETREHLPRAILCANDSMAAAVCDELQGRGVRIPEDVIVTGFDGTPTAYLGVPQLTTCHSNPEGLSKLVMDLVDRYYRGEALEKKYTHSYKTLLMESCGCGHVHHPRFNALRTFRQAETFVNHENNLYYSMEQLLELKEPLDIFRKLSATLLPGSALYLNRSMIEANPDEEYHANRIEDELIMIPYRKPDQQLIFRKVYSRDMPLPEPVTQGTHILNVIHSDTLVFGYYAAHTTDLAADTQLIKRLSDVLNMVYCIVEARNRQRQLIARFENNLYLDTLTGLSNLKGLTRWFHEYISDSDNHRKYLSLSVYSIPRYSWIFETHGMEETENTVRTVAELLRQSNPDALIITRLNEEQFSVARCSETEADITARIGHAEQEFLQHLEAVNAQEGRSFHLEVSFGSTLLKTGWESTTVENLIHLAIGEMYLNRLRTGTHENPDAETAGHTLYNSLILLLEKNLIRYFFQPIVDAHTGQIYAYEALMRSGGGIQLTPMQILSAAREYGRLYDVEQITLFGIIDRYVRDYRSFSGCKVFINTIPGHFLTEEDCSEIMARYGSYLDCFVLELTEDDPTSDEELKRIKKLSHPGNQMQIAVDDYGTGHSNIVNLLRYAPQIIKIDRALITDIDKDTNKQLFVRNTIDFAHQNNIRALAEGVETADELRTVIEFGIDLIQGFYTGRPSPQPVPVINENVRNEIIRMKLQAVQYGSTPLTYTMSDGEKADLLQLRLQQVNCIRMGSGSFVLTGDPKQSVDMILRVDDNSECTITFDGINIRGVTEPTVVFGRSCRVTLMLKGENTLRKEGIVVPPDSFLTVLGDGSLHINNNRNYSAGIGGRYNDPYGTIVLDLDGKLSFSSAGDRICCIGGGRSAGRGIRLVRGTYDISASGINVVCIGSSLGDASVHLGEISLSAHGEGNEVLLIGSVSGKAKIVSSGSLRLSAACERATGIGAISGDAEISFDGGSAVVSVSCDSGAAIGTFSGEHMTTVRNTLIRLHGEGNQLAGLGSLLGIGEVRIESGEICGDLLAAEKMILGSEGSRCVVTGGNLNFARDRSAMPVSPDGTPLVFRMPEEDHFERTFRDRKETWTYRADRNAEGKLGVFVPEADPGQLP
ncbi:MAG: EAL domain-containing protein [Clostridia bacterium]|nr:EAL domain-containing protein [Clostridia bacterium]